MPLKILVGSPIRQKPSILKEFLGSLEQIKKTDLLVDYYFVDDNDEEESTKLLTAFKNEQSEASKHNVVIKNGVHHKTYHCTDINHQWNAELINKVALYKNDMIIYCQNYKYDYLFLIDSDLYLHPNTLIQLISTNKEIVSEIFWTKWHPNSIELPQVWMYDQYLFSKDSSNVNDTKSQAVINKFKQPGLYKVGGLGACTLISQKAINAGVNYNELYNVSFWGEDRHFSIKAVALGFELFVDTTYPAYHIYREKELEGLKSYKESLNEKVCQDTRLINRDRDAVIALTNEFLKNYLSCDYRITTGYESFNFLSSYLTSKLSQLKEEFINTLIERKIISGCEPKNVNINDMSADTARVYAACVITGNMNEIDSSKKYDCEIELIKQQEKWLINDLSFYDHNEKSLLGKTLIDLLNSKVRVCKETNNKLALAMLVRNEADKFIQPVLAHASKYVDNAVILDDASDDDTVQICKKTLSEIPLTIISNESPRFHNEIALRTQLWNMVIDTNPDWILFLDADEIFENRMTTVIQDLINQPVYDYYNFRLFDMWDMEHYREDYYWKAHCYYRPFLMRYQPNFTYTWEQTPQHCGRLPNNIYKLNGCSCNIRLKHYGWSNQVLRKSKYDRYMKLDPEGKYGNIYQYRTILDPNPNLIKWKD